MPGIFLTLEGGEGTGKSTQAKRLASHIESLGLRVVLTREPGGTSEAELLRNLLVNGAANRWTPTAEALINYAAREHHLEHLIRPALQRGDVVICDRFMDSTRAYQGLAGGCPLSLIDSLEASVVGPTRPDLTLLFDLDPAVGLARAKARGEGGEDRYERKGMAFHSKLRSGFLDIAAANTGRVRVIDASLAQEDVFADVWNAVKGLFRGR